MVWGELRGGRPIWGEGHGVNNKLLKMIAVKLEFILLGVVELNSDTPRAGCHIHARRRDPLGAESVVLEVSKLISDNHDNV